MTPIYRDPTRSPEERAEDLLRRMTPEEKFAQMRLMNVTAAEQRQADLDPAVAERNARRCGQMYNCDSMTVANRNRLQDWAVNRTRLGIPVAIHGEGLHGLRHGDAVVFPQSVGMACAFDRDLTRQVAEEIGREARDAGFHLLYAPDLDLARDPRWGRTEETFGEDPYLTGEMGVTYIRGIQSQGVAACVKHYVAHGSPEAGLNLAPVHLGRREFRELMLPPFARAVVEAGAEAVMPAYSEWDGVPIHASRRLTRDLLRGELGFRGVTVSDYGAVKMLCTFHRVAEDEVAAGKLALEAGIDVEARTPFGYGEKTEQAAREGRISMDRIDEAVRRLLIFKFRHGLFDRPFTPEPSVPFRRPESLALARRAGRESVVLLKNENGLLPLSPAVGKIALIGPNADAAQMGDYTAAEAMAHCVTLRRAMTERLGADRVLYAKGCAVAGGDDAMLREAVCAAESADLAVVALGDNSNFYGGVGWGDAAENGQAAITCGEGFDSASLDLPGRQQELLEAVAATGKPVILILETGRPYAIRWADEHIPAILQAWYPGEQGGYALTELLFGDECPCGKLSVSIPRSVGHLPCCYNRKPSAGGYYHKPGSKSSPGRDYVFDTPGALYRFGYGLSYTTFAYSNLTLSRNVGRAEDPLTVTVTVKNTGARAAKEAVLLYVTDEYCRITPFTEQLKGFDKIELSPGEEKTVAFRLERDAFAFVNEDMEWEVEPGFFRIRVEDQTVRYEITKD